MPLPDVEWVFFDVGYTLVNEDAAVEDRIQQLHGALMDCGLRVTHGDIRTAIEQAATEFAPVPAHQAVTNLTGSGELAQRVIARTRWRKDLDKPYPEAARVLCSLSDRYKVGIIANQSLGTESRLEMWDLLRFVSVCIASAEVGLNKPDSAIFELALSNAGCEPAQVVMIGDRIDNDIAPAKSLGWSTIRIRQGLFRGQVARCLEERPDYEVGRLEQILHTLL